MFNGIGSSQSPIKPTSPVSSNKVAPEPTVGGQPSPVSAGTELAKPAAGSTPEKPSPNQKSILKEAGSVLKTVIKVLGAAVVAAVGLAVGTVASTIAGAIRGSAEGSAAGASIGDSYGGTIGAAVGSLAGGILGAIAGAAAGAVAPTVMGVDALARNGGSLFSTKASPKTASPETIGKHKASTESQLTVALENFKLAATKLGIPEGKINSKAEDLKQTTTAKINEKYTESCDLNSINKEFRDKHDDFGLTAELGEFFRLTSPDKEDRECKAAAKSAMKETKPAAIDTVGQTKAKEGFSSDIKVGDSTYKTDIKMQTTDFVSSASSKANGNTCGNLNLQTLTGKDGTVLFKTLRHAALTAKPDPTETKDPFSKEEPKGTAASKAISLCENLNSKDTTKVEDATQELKKYGINAEEFRDKKESVDASKLTKKMAKQCGLLNKALDVGKAAWAAQGSPSGTVNITSLSLMTPDRPRAGLDGKGGEVGKLKDQVEAFKLLQNLESADLVGMGIGSADKPVNFNVMTFNFGVNEGESLGRGLQKDGNAKAMTGLEKLTTEKLTKLDQSLITMEDGPEKTKLTVEKETLQALSENIQELYKTYTSLPTDLSKGLWRADQAYNLTAKISFLTELCDGVNTCNCASGKDRTGMHVQNSLNYAGLMRDRMEGRMEGRMGDLKYEKMSNQNQIKHLDAHHFDVLEAVAKDVHVTEVTDFIKCIKEKGTSLTASDLKPFLTDGDKPLNLSTAQGNAVKAFTYPLTVDSLTTLDLLKTSLLFSGQGALSSQTSFMDKALLKLKEKNGSSSMGVKSTWEMIIDPQTSATDKVNLQTRNEKFMTGTGQHEVQEWNTGSAGYKLYSDTLPNLLTRGGQTESYFMTMFGGTKADVANTVTMQAKYNAT